MMQFLPGILEEIRSCIQILQEQDNQILGEASNSFSLMGQELEAHNTMIFVNGLQILAAKTSVPAGQKTSEVLSKCIDEVNRILASITESMKNIPST